MATYTSNYNLYMPDPTDPVGDFRTQHNNNMQIIDQNLGGGGGGGGGGNVYGAFIDTNRVIASGSYSSSYSYTATEDCYLFFTCGGTTSSSGKLYLEGNLIRYIFVNNSNNNYGDGIYLKKGQTAEVQSPQAGTFQYIVYGLTQGTKNIFTPIIYSDTERVIGVWRDNKPLYKKTWFFNSTIIINANTWTSLGISAGDIENVVMNETIDDEGRSNSVNYCGVRNSYISAYSDLATSIQVLTLYYTKTTDVAGSGNWNTDGVPTHHYSTAEQIIGTWIDGKPLYEITIDVANPSNDTNEHLIDLTSLSIEECPYLFGYAVRHSGSNDLTYYANSIEANDWYYFKARYDNFRDSIMYTCLFRNDSISRMRFTIQYTKSTD